VARVESVSIACACPEGVTPTKKSLPAKWTVALVSLFVILLLIATSENSGKE
jgi:hypothetical protein